MSNPILNENFGGQERILDSAPMTINGAVNKSLILFSFLLIGAACNWYFLMNGFADKASLLMTGGAIIGFILAIIITFKTNLAKTLAPVYAICEGLVLGGISALFEAAYSGIAFQAVAATFAVLFSMLILYKARLIQYTDKFAGILRTALLSVMLIYLIQFVASFFGRGIPAIFGNGLIGIGFSAVVVLIAAFCLIQDFHFIESGAERMLPQDYEWYGAFGLMVTLVWLYLEILRFFAKLNSRR